MKVVINRCYGGFSLSRKAMELLVDAGCKEAAETLAHYDADPLLLRLSGNDSFHLKIDRADPLLVEVVEGLGDEASGRFASLEVVEVSDDAKWEVEEYDGFEHIREVSRSWP
jgi:hypothetical protein